jgi:hypothetical protein
VKPHRKASVSRPGNGRAIVNPDGAYGGPAQPSPTIAQCLNGGYGWLQVKLTQQCEIAPYKWVHPDDDR